MESVAGLHTECAQARPESLRLQDLCLQERLHVTVLHLVLCFEINKCTKSMNYLCDFFWAGLTDFRLDDRGFFRVDLTDSRLDDLERDRFTGLAEMEVAPGSACFMGGGAPRP